MRRFQKLIIILLILLSFLTPQIMPITKHTSIAQAATIKLSNKSITLEVGKTKLLHLYGTKRKVTWTSSRKTVASVSSKGTVSAKAVGTAMITATVSGKKYTCKVTVTKPKNPYLAKAPFKAVETDIENINFVIPSDWKAAISEVSKTSLTAGLTPEDTSKDSNITLKITLTNEKALEYSKAKEEFVKSLTEDSVNQLLLKTYGKIKITNFKQSDFKVNYFSALKTEYTIPLKNGQLKQIQYDFYLDKYQIKVTVTQDGEDDYQSIAEYMLKSIIVK
jgi:hypothetical protein